MALRDQISPELAVSLGNCVDFKCRRGRRNSPSSIWLNHGDLLVTDGLAQSEHEHSTSSELQGPLPLRSDGYHNTRRPATGRRNWLCSTFVRVRFSRVGSPGGR